MDQLIWPPRVSFIMYIDPDAITSGFDCSSRYQELASHVRAMPFHIEFLKIRPWIDTTPGGEVQDVDTADNSRVSETSSNIPDSEAQSVDTAESLGVPETPSNVSDSSDAHTDTAVSLISLEELEPRTRGCFWLYDEALLETDLDEVPWLRSDISSSVSALCRLCQHLDFRHLFSSAFGAYKVSKLDEEDIAFQGLVLGTCRELEQRAAEGCVFCDLLQQQLQSSSDWNRIIESADLGQFRYCVRALRIEAGLASPYDNPLSPEQCQTRMHDTFELSIHISPFTVDSEDGLCHDVQPIALVSGPIGNSLSPSARAIDHEIDFDIPRNWLRSCRKAHGGHDGAECPPRFPKATQGSHQTLFLHVHKLRPIERYISDTEYVALTYTWGSNNTLQTTSKNLEQFLQPDGLRDELEHMPKTAQDAITVCQQFGFELFWIDALCIVQDSDEKHKQLVLMDLIYSESALTIAAAVGDGSHAGLAGVSPGSRAIRQKRVFIERGLELAGVLPDPEVDIQNSVWNSRCWTFQERLLSQRLLIFGPSQLQYHCRHGRCVESETRDPHTHPDGLRCVPSEHVDTALSTSNGPVAEGSSGRREYSRMRYSGFITYHGLVTLGVIDFELHAELVDDYCGRRLSYQTDGLNAFHGLLSVISRTFTTTTVTWVLPFAVLDLALLWRARVTLQRRRTNEVRFPSWSWAGWIGTVEYACRCRALKTFRPMYGPSAIASGPRTPHIYSELGAEITDWVSVSEDPAEGFTRIGTHQRHCRPKYEGCAELEIFLRVDEPLVLRTDVAELVYSGKHVTHTKRTGRYTYSDHEDNWTMEIHNAEGKHIGFVILDSGDSELARVVVPRTYRFVAINRKWPVHSNYPLLAGCDRIVQGQNDEPGAPADHVIPPFNSAYEGWLC